MEEGRAILNTNTRRNLVSYLDDANYSDDELSGENSSPFPVTSVMPAVNPVVTTMVTGPEFTDVKMPPEPVGSCSNKLQQKIITLTEKMETSKADMNQIIQGRKSFRNPSIYEKLIQFCNINEFGTNYEPSIYDPLKWDKSSFYDELSKLQKLDMMQREKQRTKRFQVEFLTGTAKKISLGPPTNEVTIETKKRKTKWDIVGI